jgi:putative restriction endonuclease
LNARIAFGVPDQESPAPPKNALERRYALRAVKQRLHQASFREAVITAYNGRCALSGLPESLLLDAAHIVADKDEPFGQPIVPNGIPLSKIHHAAFDAHLIGIDPDYRLHVSDRLLGQHDGPLLEALKRLNGGTIHLPSRCAISRYIGCCPTGRRSSTISSAIGRPMTITLTLISSVKACTAMEQRAWATLGGDV